MNYKKMLIITKLSEILALRIVGKEIILMTEELSELAKT